MNPRYALAEIRKNGSDPAWWRKRFLTHVVGSYFRRFGPPGDPVTDEEWDNLLVLDACRYDLFAAASDLPGTLSKRRSVASATPGFLRETFDGRQFHDVVYVSSNPYVDVQLPDDTFHAVDSVWRDGWHDELDTVLPETMAERAREADERYPDKRLVVHFLQPHYPFIGDVRLDGDSTFGVRNQAMGSETLGAEERAPTPFERLQFGQLTLEEVWEAYRSNLERALPAVDELLHELQGLNVVTSDHGNAVGERAWPFPIRVYGHPLGVNIPELTEVPWLEYRNGARKEVTAEPPEYAAHETDADVTDRLRQLGYAE